MSADIVHAMMHQMASFLGLMAVSKSTEAVIGKALQLTGFFLHSPLT